MHAVNDTVTKLTENALNATEHQKRNHRNTPKNQNWRQKAWVSE